MALTDTALRNLKPKTKPYRVTDERGLYVEVSTKGGLWFRFKYSYAGKEKRLSLGMYPEVSLKQARAKRDEARQLVAAGTDPSVERKREKLAAVLKSKNTFEAVGREWFANKAAIWSATHAETNEQRLRDYAYPHLGNRPIAEITALDLLAVIRKVQERSVEVAHRTLRLCGQIFRYGIVTGRCERDVAADLRDALPPFRNSHFAATLEPKRLGSILRLIDHFYGTPPVRAALRLAPLLFVRPGELRRAEWAHIDWDAAEWSCRVTKVRDESRGENILIVPLSKQALAVLEWLKPITGHGRYLFPSARTSERCMSEVAVNVAMRSVDIGKDEMTGHGFRAVARTLLDEVLGFRPEIIEHQLSHTVRDPLGRAYNRTQHLAERHRMMQVWADHLDALKVRSEFTVMPKRA